MSQVVPPGTFMFWKDEDTPVLPPSVGAKVVGVDGTTVIGTVVGVDEDGSFTVSFDPLAIPGS